ncbi:prephenate dehydratase [Faecalibacillus intestinalis]|jgi:chorismate mutase/prephenate dehydratase|uniref:prephenate dehydratase n=1 Tax=Faecalibacillus intestinalis TaxID=1982626 RepID=UPI0022E8DF5F|nr:prephenate dehydratase [Faecalibacillus intestinalis]
MKDLKQCRIEIDAIDQQLMELFEKRMALSKSVVEYKIENHLEIFQPEREREVIEKNLNRLNNDQLKEYARCFIQEMMTVSKSYQSDLLPLELDKNIKTEFKKDPLVGYQGIAGAFSQSAVENFFGEGTRNIGYKDFEDVYVALEDGEIDYGVLPIENSLTGSINDNYDLIRKYGFYIVGETAVNVSQCLMALPGTKIEDIRQVYSHPQGLAQSSEFLYQHRYIEQRPFQDTAMAAKYVMDSKDPTKAAIASPLACKLYGLEMLKENVQNKKNNRTRFMVISKELICPKESDKVSVIFTLPHQVGALDNMLQTIKQSQINMDRIESRPIETQFWQYYFYIDFEGNMHEERIQRAINKMKANSTTLKVLGNYKRA